MGQINYNAHNHPRQTHLVDETLALLPCLILLPLHFLTFSFLPSFPSTLAPSLLYSFLFLSLSIVLPHTFSILFFSLSFFHFFPSHCTRSCPFSLFPLVLILHSPLPICLRISSLSPLSPFFFFPAIFLPPPPILPPPPPPPLPLYILTAVHRENCNVPILLIVEAYRGWRGWEEFV